tara:strand:- start:1001 stop:1156 length:156 start_codon:yes stop_codon:yes gene_type:complete
MDAKAPYKAGGEAFTPSGASGKLATNVCTEEAAGTTSVDESIINRTIDILV